MKRRTVGLLVLLLLAGFGVVPAGAGKTPPMEATVVHKGFKEGELVRVQKGAQIPMFHVIAGFYERAFSALAAGEASFRQLLKEMEIEPESEPAKALAKAALLAEALRYDGEAAAKFLPDENAYLEAQRRNLRADKDELVRIHAELLRRFQKADYPLEKLHSFLEREIRAGMAITIYGGKPGEPSLTYVITGNFAEEVERALAAASGEDAP